MLKIYLIRHGQDVDNFNKVLNGHRNTQLTDLGVKQGHDLAKGIQGIGLTFKKVYSSPLDRVYNTALATTEALGIDKPIKYDDLIERNYGVMHGKAIKDIPELCSPHILKAGLVTYFLQAEGAETWPEVYARAQKVLKDITEKEQDGNILLATHGDMGKMLYAAYYNLGWEHGLQMFHFGNSELLLLSPDSSAEDSHVLRAEQFNH